MLASPTTDTEYLQSLRSVRERCFKVQEAAARQRLQHFDVDPSKLDDMVHIVVSLIKRDFDHPTDMPVHGRWRHFDVGGRPRIQNLIQSWASLGEQPLEQTRRVLDLFVVAVLLDIETGHNWAYREQLTGRMLKRNEGVAVAVLEMFMAGTFSSDSNKPHRVDCKYTIIYQPTRFFFSLKRFICMSAEALCALSMETLVKGLQVKQHHTFIWAGLNDRLDLLHHLGHIVSTRNDYFGGVGTDVARPGNLMGKLVVYCEKITKKSTNNELAYRLPPFPPNNHQYEEGATHSPRNLVAYCARNGRVVGCCVRQGRDPWPGRCLALRHGTI